MDTSLAQLALIFLPGIIWASLNETYGSSPKVSPTKLALQSFLFGITTYSVLYVVYSVAGFEFSASSLEDASTSALTKFADEIIWSVPLSLVLAIAWLYSVRHKWVMKFLFKIGASSRFGPEDVWSFTFNSTQPHVEYVDVRDCETGFVYSGWVNAYSETDDTRELLLVDAIVYSEEGDVISESPHLYLARPKSNIWIEFPYKEEVQNV